MWWRRSKPDFDPVDHWRGTLAQTKAIAEAEQQGRRAWRILVVNSMLAETYHNRAEFPRPYKWRLNELLHLSGEEIPKAKEHESDYSG